MHAPRYQKIVAGPKATSVLCLACGRWVKLLEAYADSQGKPFTYYHEACPPQEVR